MTVGRAHADAPREKVAMIRAGSLRWVLFACLIGASHARAAPRAVSPPSPTPVAPAPATQAQKPAPSTPRPLGEAVAAIVNDDVISTYDLRQRVRLLIISSGVQPTEQNMPDIEREALKGLVDERLQLQEIKSVEKRQKDLKLSPPVKEVDEEVSSYAKQFKMSPAQFVSSLRASGVDEQTLRDQITTAIAWRRYVSGRFRDNVHVGDEQVSAAMDRIDANAMRPQYLVSEIFLDNARVGGAAAASEGAGQLIAQIRQGAPFSAVARQFSALPTAANGGDSGWLVSGQMPSVVEHALETLRPGQVSEPVAVTDGVYILQLRDRRAGAGAVVVQLKQAAIRLPADASAEQAATAEGKLVALKGEVRTCDQLAPAAARAQGVVAGDLGEVNPDDLSADFKRAIENLKPGQIGGPVRTKSGLHLLQVCARHVGGAAAPSKSDVENSLLNEQIAMIEKRYMRDLRNSAAIETR